MCDKHAVFQGVFLSVCSTLHDFAQGKAIAVTWPQAGETLANQKNFLLGNGAGGLVTANLAHAMEPFVTSVAIGKDCIPRMSLKNLSRFMEGEHEGYPVHALSTSWLPFARNGQKTECADLMLRLAACD